MIKVIFFAVIIGFFNGCHKPCNLPNYTFLVNDHFTPEKDSIQIGDTLWLTCAISKTLVDINSQEKVNFPDAQNLGTNLIISDISKFNLQRGAVDSFAYVQIRGNIYTDQTSNPHGAKQIGFEEDANYYLLEVGLVAIKMGTYILTVPDNPYVFRKGMTKCGTASFQILNSNTNKHLYLFENIWGQLSEYDSTHSYCFKVY